MARTPDVRRASRAWGRRARERRVPVTGAAFLGADALGGSVLGALFVPDVVVPEQCVAGVRRDSTGSGEKALLLAVLKDGIRCFQAQGQRPRPNPHALAAEAAAWITAGDDDHPCSFEHICEVLGFDPGRLRAGLLAGKGTHAHETETRAHPPRSEQAIRRRPVVGTPHAPAPSPLRAAGSAARRCSGWSPKTKTTARRAEPSADMPRQAG